MSHRLATSSKTKTVTQHNGNGATEQANLDVSPNSFWNPRRSALPRDPLFTFRGWPIPSYSVLTVLRTFTAAKSHATVNSGVVTPVKNILRHLFETHHIHLSNNNLLLFNP